MDLVRVIETACLFDPGNQTARELLARVRWGRNAAYSSENEFFFARRRSDAWRKHVEEFGFGSNCPAPINRWWETNSVASEYVLSAWRPFELFRFSQYDQARWGVPRDAGGRELRGWQRQFAMDFFARLLAAPDDPRHLANARGYFYGALAINGDEFVVRDPRLRKRILVRLWPHVLNSQRAEPHGFDDAHRQGLAMHFHELGEIGGEQEWLTQWEAAGRETAEERVPGPIQLPRVSTLDANEFQPQTRP
jgi:hypothetical protein